MFVVETLDEVYDVDFIAHHGTKGMRWGQRRYQNPDGSLTPAGRKRYMKNNRFRQKYLREQAKRLEEERRKTETAKQRHDRIMKSSNAEEILKNKDLLTTEELKERINRIKTEQELATYIKKSPTKMDKAKKHIDNAIAIADKVGKFADTKVGQMAIKEVKKQLGIETKKTVTYKDYKDILNDLKNVDSNKLKDYKERAQNEKDLRNALEELRKINEKEQQRIQAEQQAQQQAQQQQQQLQQAQQQARRRKRRAYWTRNVI